LEKIPGVAFKSIKYGSKYPNEGEFEGNKNKAKKFPYTFIPCIKYDYAHFSSTHLNKF